MKKLAMTGASGEPIDSTGARAATDIPSPSTTCSCLWSALYLPPTYLLVTVFSSPTGFPYKYTFPCTYSITSNILTMKMEQIECSETSEIINQTPGNHPKEDILYSEHGKSLKSRKLIKYKKGVHYSEIKIFNHLPQNIKSLSCNVKKLN
jgi:hypothetical protein